MSVDRPTFTDSWTLVAPLRPALRADVRSCAHGRRAGRWIVLRDGAGEQHVRLSRGAYAFAGLLDGSRTVDDAWRAAQRAVGDDAPTQGEAVRILGALYGANLLRPDLPDDAESLLRRRTTRRSRQAGAAALSALFIRIPLLNPDRALDAVRPIVAWLFTRWGFALWLMLIALALAHLAGRERELLGGASGVIAPSNLPWLFAVFLVVKALHEVGHGVACKALATREGAPRAEVREAGVMLLVFTPVPYVDCSAAWSLRSKWRRAAVGAAGMYAELFVASVAAIVWSRTSSDSLVHALCYNAIFIAGVSTVLFNANPLLRFDGYYILSDLTNSPNLARRAQDQLHAWVKRVVWGVRRALAPARSPREARWLVAYALGSGAYKVFVFGAIILFIVQRYAFLGAALAAVALLGWLVIPAARLLNYLTSSPELESARPRAALTTLSVVAAVALLVGAVPAPDRVRAQGVVEPSRVQTLFAPHDGFVVFDAPGGHDAAKDALVAGDVVLTLDSPELRAAALELAARRDELAARRRQALATDPAAARIVAEQLDAVEFRLAAAHDRLDALRVRAPFDGVWAPATPGKHPAFVREGDELGAVVDANARVVRAVLRQSGAHAPTHVGAPVTIRAPGDAETLLRGRVVRVSPASVDRLPSVALGAAGGGDALLATNTDDPVRARERFFEVVIEPVTPADADPASLADAHTLDVLRPGRRVLVRFDAGASPLGAQWLRALRRTLQRGTES